MATQGSSDTTQPNPFVGFNVLMQKASTWTASIALGLALLGVASGSIFFVIAGRDMSPNAIACNRLWIAALAFGLWNGYEVWRRSPTHATAPVCGVRLQDWLMLVAAGASFAAFLVLLAWALTQTSVAKASLLTHMMPIFTTLGGWLVWQQQVSRRFLVGMGVAVCSAIAIGVGDLQAAGDNLLGDLAALGAAVLLATEMLLVAQLRSRFATSLITCCECTIGSVLVLPTVLLSGDRLLPPSWQSSAAILGLALMTQMLGHGLLTYSLKQVSAGFVSVALLAVPVLAAVIASVLFGQTIALGDGGAFLGVLLGIYISISAPQANDLGRDRTAETEA